MGRNFVAQDNGDDTGKLLRSRRVDTFDSGVCMNAARDSHMQHARQDNVVNVSRCARYQARIFFSLHCLTDVTLRHDELLISGSEFRYALQFTRCVLNGFHNVLVPRASA